MEEHASPIRYRSDSPILLVDKPLVSDVGAGLR